MIFKRTLNMSEISLNFNFLIENSIPYLCDT